MRLVRFNSHIRSMRTFPCEWLRRQLVGTAKSVNEGAAVSVYVAPVVLPLSHTLANIHGSGNAVTVTSQNMGPCLYTGPGAGRYPTANSVVADILRIAAQPTAAPAAFPKQAADGTPNITDYASAFYVRVAATGGGTLPDASAMLEWAKQVGVPEASVIDAAAAVGAMALTTAPCAKSMVDQWASNIPADCSVLVMPKM